MINLDYEPLNRQKNWLPQNIDHMINNVIFKITEYALNGVCYVFSFNIFLNLGNFLWQ